MTSGDEDDVVRVLRATLDVPVEASFHKAGAMNSLPTYRVPPIPTLQGLLYAALGRPSLLLSASTSGSISNETRSDEESFRQSVRDECRFGVRIIEPGDTHIGLRKRHKALDRGEKSYVGYPTQAETLIEPTYRMYVGGPVDRLETFASALRDPERLLYLGRSDDLVDIRDVETIRVEHHAESTRVECVIPGPGDDPTLLPVEPDYRDGRTTKPARVETVSLTGGMVDNYYETSDGEQFVFVT
jgi:CRISPR-associated Cas5-like protein